MSDGSLEKTQIDVTKTKIKDKIVDSKSGEFIKEIIQCELPRRFQKRQAVEDKIANPKMAWNKSLRGYKYFQLLSALQKDIRRGNEEEAVFWATELESMGPNQLRALWNRLKIIASEDIGKANQIAPLIIYLLEIQYYDLKKTNNKHKPERLPLVNAVSFLANSLKSRVVDNLLNVVYGEKDLEKNNPQIPEYAIDRHTREGAKGEEGIEEFFDEGTKLDREAIVDPYKEKAKEILMIKEQLMKT